MLKTLNPTLKAKVDLQRGKCDQIVLGTDTSGGNRGIGEMESLEAWNTQL